MPASSLYAIAALGSGHSFINFTPSLADSPAAIDELARSKAACHYGCDGKTGETLMKSVLAPMFARRNMQVKSWVGHNIFGNMDGQVLDDPENKRAKVASKDHLIREILGYKPNTLVSIEYLPDLGDWKTAWDHIHFAGFLGVPMTLQFTWQGSDSVLAAPLVLDLVRFAELARRLGHVGHLTFLESFFKSPYGATEHCFDRQFETLERWGGGMQNRKRRLTTFHYLLSTGYSRARRKKKRPKRKRVRKPRAAATDKPAAADKPAKSGFAAMGLSKPMLATLKDADYLEPTPIQAGLIPRALEGIDLMGQAQTGTGKTAAFCIPILERLNSREESPWAQALVLAPTRELAVQVRDECVKLSAGGDARVAAVYGGKPIRTQVRTASSRCGDRRRHARSSDGPDEPRLAGARRGPLRGSRRGRPDAGHRLPARH